MIKKCITTGSKICFFYNEVVKTLTVSDIFIGMLESGSYGSFIEFDCQDQYPIEMILDLFYFGVMYFPGGEKTAETIRQIRNERKKNDIGN